MKDIGVLLKEKRTENGVSIAEAAEDLEVDEAALENMEDGNVRAFKDMYTLKELVKDYAKYLGMDVNDILEEFNDFLFEHTSKISLEEIRETRVQLQDTSVKKIASPYTRIPKPKRDYKKILFPILIICLVVLIIMFLISSFRKSPKRRVELKNMNVEVIYEFA